MADEFTHQHQCPGARGVAAHPWACTVMCCRDKVERECHACKTRGAEPGPPR